MCGVFCWRALTTLNFSSVVNGDSGSGHCHSDVRNTTSQGNIREEILIWIFFTLHVIIDGDGVGPSDVASIECHNLTTHWYIVTINNRCVCGTNIIQFLMQNYKKNLLAVPSAVLTARVKGRGAPVVGWLKTLIVRVTLPSISVLVYKSGS